jgi:hypothetical protein
MLARRTGTTAEFVERLLEKGKGEPHLNCYV